MARGVRKVKISRRKLVGKFAGFRGDHEVTDFESLLEMDYLYLLAFDPDVLAVKSQPIKVEYFLDNRVRHYTPDFEVVRTGGVEIVEVKPEKFALREDNVRMFAAVTPLIEKDGARFVILTEKTIRQQPRLANIKRLARYSRTPVSPELQLVVYRFFKDAPVRTFGELCQFLDTRGIGKAAAFALIRHGVGTIDLMQPIGPTSQVHYQGLKSNPGKKVA
jgi:hypothetical protein